MNYDFFDFDLMEQIGLGGKWVVFDEIEKEC